MIMGKITTFFHNHRKFTLKMIETKCENIDDNERTREPFSTKLGKKYNVVFIRQCDTELKAGNYVYRLLY